MLSFVKFLDSSIGQKIIWYNFTWNVVLYEILLIWMTSPSLLATLDISPSVKFIYFGLWSNGTTSKEELSVAALMITTKIRITKATTGDRQMQVATLFWVLEQKQQPQQVLPLSPFSITENLCFIARILVCQVDFGLWKFAKFSSTAALLRKISSHLSFQDMSSEFLYFHSFSQ